MKKTEIILTLLFLSGLFSQSEIYSQDKKNSDNLNVPERDFVSEFGISMQRSSAVPYTYDSIRKLNEINTPSNADAFPWLSSDGLRLYYTSGANFEMLAFTSRPNVSSFFATPVTLPISIPHPSSYWLTPNELDVYICNDDLYLSHRTTTASPFAAPVQINLTQPYGSVTYRAASLDTSQNRLFVSAFNGSYIGLFEFTRTSATSFTYVRTLPKPPGYIAYTGQLSKDDLTYFMSASGSTGKTKLYQLTRNLPTDSFLVSSFQEIQNINDSLFLNNQPSMSNNLDWVAFVRSSQDSWSWNDLFIASKEGIITSVFDPNETRPKMRVYPNPAVSSFVVQFNKYIRNGELQIYNIQGQRLKTITEVSGESIHLLRNDLQSGLYFIHLFQDQNILSTDRLLISDN